MLKRNLLFTAALPLMSLSFATTAMAQEAVQTTPVAAVEDEAEADEEIVVTGSRIKRPGLDTIRPIESVTAEVLDKRAFTNIADALNEVPIFGNGVNPNGGQNAFTVGQNFVDLFDLGTQRTLTLVNGRRFVSTNTPTAFGTVGGLQVDLNSIPVALLSRVEVVPLAGAAVYGSDAIAGTLNVILRDDFEGFEASGQYGLTQRGDGNLYQAQVAFGANFAEGRGNVALAVEYSQQEGLLLNARPRLVNDNFNNVGFGSLRVDRDGDGIADNLVPTNRANPACQASLSTGNPNFPLGPGCPVGSDFNGDGFADTFDRQFANQSVQLFTNFGTVAPTDAPFIPSFGSGSLADGNFYQFNPDGTLGTCTPGVTPGVSSAFFAQGGTCGIDFFDSTSQIRSPVDRIVITGLSHYDLANNVRFFTETTFANSSATELVAQGGFQSIAFGGTSNALTLQTSNPFLTAQARDVLTRNGLTEFQYSRFNNDLVGAGQNSTENFTWRVASGFEGNFDLFGRGFNWDVSAVFGQSDVDTRTFGIIDGRFINALDAVTVNDALLDELISCRF